MLNWLLRLMKGDHSPAGNQTEHAPSDGRDDETPPLPAVALTPSVQERARSARQWQVQKTIERTVDTGLGQEERWSFDQETGTLLLTFADQSELRVGARILGSFDPADKSFMWGWANASLREGARVDAREALLAEGVLPDPAFTTAKQSASFEELLSLVLIAAQVSGTDGVCRLVANGRTSVFVALDVLNPSEAAVEALTVTASECRAWVEEYAREMYQVDAAYDHASKDPNQLNVAVAKKDVIYDRYWSRDDDYHRPCSVGWPSEYDPDGVRERFEVSCKAGGMLAVSVSESGGVRAYRVERHAESLRIVDQLLDFDSIQVWPKST